MWKKIEQKNNFFHMQLIMQNFLERKLTFFARKNVPTAHLFHGSVPRGEWHLLPEVLCNFIWNINIFVFILVSCLLLHICMDIQYECSIWVLHKLGDRKNHLARFCADKIRSGKMCQVHENCLK